MTTASAGENVGVLLRGIKLNSVRRGMILCEKNFLKLTNHYEAQLYLLSPQEGGRERPLKVLLPVLININFIFIVIAYID